MTEHEQRTIDVDVRDLDTRGRTLHGYASVYGIESNDLGGFREKIAPGAFRDVLADADVRCLLNHDPSQVLGRTRAGTLRLFDEERGLRFACDLPESPLGENVREATQRGDIDGASFRFVCGSETWDDAREVRTVTQVSELHDVSVATYGAYPAASVELRTRPEKTEEKENLVNTNTTSTAGEAAPAVTNSTGGLTVEQRTVAPDDQSLETRVTDALRSVRKGENRSLTTTSAAAIAPGEISTYLFDKLRPASVMLQAGINVVTTTRDSVTWPKLSADVTPTWYSEMDAITPGDPSFVSLTATPRKLAHLVQVSNETVDDSDPGVVTVLNTHLATMLALRLDYFLLEGNGTAPQIRGLKSTSGIQTIDNGGANGGQLTNLDAIADAIGLLEAANVPGPYVTVMPPRTWAAIRKFKDTTNAPLLTATPTVDAPMQVFNSRVFTSAQLTVAETQGTSTDANSIYVFSPSQIILVRRQDAVIELDRSRLFNVDASELRAKARVDVLVPNPVSVVRIKGVRP
jgi:HK97 family phage major capsid protein